MKRSNLIPHLGVSVFLLCLAACNTQPERSKVAQGDASVYEAVNQTWIIAGQQIADYVRNIHEDKNGGLWFGTNGYGVAHYDGDSLHYYSIDEGFDGQQITGITQDPKRNLWFATDRGVVMYDWSSNVDGGKQFTNYTDPKYFKGQRFWSIFADRKGNIWAGGVAGIFKYTKGSWSPFDLPLPEEVSGDFITKGTTWGITEDSKGNIWFSTNGFGAYKYDGNSFKQVSEKDGLTNNDVDDIIEDSEGNMWFGTRFGGVSRLDLSAEQAGGKVFTTYNQANSIENNEVCVIYEDRAGHVWFSSEGYGVYRYDPAAKKVPIGEPFSKVKLPLDELGLTNYAKEEGLGVGAVQTIFEDSKGRLWVGGGGGLYRFVPEAGRFINVQKDGPWEEVKN